MIDSEPRAPTAHAPGTAASPGTADVSGSRGPDGSPDEAVSRLRGADVATVDVRRIGQGVVGICLVALAVVAAILFVAGAQKNAQITRLRQHGVAVTVRVTGCFGLLGGSGSNAAGYSCTGTYTVGGHRFTQAIPGDTLRATGSTVRAVSDPNDPALLSTAHAVASQHASWTVFVVPTILLVALALVVGALLLRRRRLARA